MALSFKLKGALPDASAMLPEMQQEPVQTETEREPFGITYRGKNVAVVPVAEYELWGLVVSHNNIESIADIYHDSSSIDTKDLCVVWGSNLVNGDLEKIRFKSGPFFCYYWVPNGAQFRGRELSNNHMITDDKALRAQLADVNIGDQIRFKGALVNYQVEDWQDFWRASSTIREDGGGGACEVVYFEEIEVLQAGTPFWYLLFDLTRLLLVVVPLLWLHTIWIDAQAAKSIYAPEPAFDGPAPDVWPGAIES
jgi:hypothetical protein